MAAIGFGAKISVNDGPEEAQQDFPQVTMLSLPAVEAAVVEVSHLGMVSNKREFIPGLQDPGTCSFECFWTAATVGRLEALRGISKTFVITSPDENGGEAGGTQTWTFTGFVTKYEGSFEPDTPSKLKADIRVTGNVTLA